MSADLNAIKARWAAATPGPWGVKVDYLDTVTGEGGDPYISAPLMEFVADVSDDANAEAIAHAPEDIAALMAEVERLTETLEEVRDELRFDSGQWDEDARGEAVKVLERRMGADWLNGRGDSE